MNSESLLHVVQSSVKKLQLDSPVDIMEVYYQDIF